MGKKKTKTTTQQTATVAPNSAYTPYIDQAASGLQSAYAAAQANNLGLMPKVNSAMDYYSNTLSGANLNGNPYLDGVISKSNADIANSVNSRFSSAGRYGSGMYAKVLASSLADNENQLRYQNYATERQYQNQAAGGLLGATGIAAALPQAAAGTYADQVRALLGQYTTGTQNGTSTTVSKPSILEVLAQLGNNAASAARG